MAASQVLADAPIFVDVDNVYDAQAVRAPYAGLVHQGVVGHYDCIVVPNGGTATNPDASPGSQNLSVTILQGNAWVRGDDSPPQQGFYLHAMSEASVNLALSANASGSTRIDRVVLTVADDPTDTTTAQIIEGTPSGSPVAPAEPSDSVTLATVSIPTGTTAINAAKITDARLYALGHTYRDVISASTTVTTSWLTIASVVAVLDRDGRLICRSNVAFSDNSGTADTRVQTRLWNSTTSATIRPSGMQKLTGSTPAHFVTDTNVAVNGAARLPAGSYTVQLQMTKEAATGSAIQAIKTQNSEAVTWLEVERG